LIVGRVIATGTRWSQEHRTQFRKSRFSTVFTNEYVKARNWRGCRERAETSVDVFRIAKSDDQHGCAATIASHEHLAYWSSASFGATARIQVPKTRADALAVPIWSSVLDSDQRMLLWLKVP
jgi:hypothetical protein